MMKKRLLAFLAAALLLLTLTACGSGNSGGTQGDGSSTATDATGTGTATGQSGDSVSTQDAAVTDAAANADATVENPTASSSTESSTSSTNTNAAASSSSGKASTVTSTSTATVAPTAPVSPSTPTSVTPTEPSTEVTADSAVKLSDVWAAMTAQMGELPALTNMSAADATTWYGIDASMLEDCVFKMPALSVQATEFFMAKVTDGNMAAVKAACLKRQAALADQWSMYLPAQGKLVDNYQLVVNGDYILFCVTDYADSAVSVFNSYTE